MSPFPRRLVIAGLMTLLALPLQALAAEVNLYSARSEELIKPLLDKFTAATGIQTHLVTGNADALLQRLQSEGVNSPADLLITSDVGRLYRAKTAGVTQAMSSPKLEAAIPAAYRDPAGHWVGLTLRARPIVYVRDRIKPEELSSYEDLANPKWKGRICIRSSDNVYNQSLVASLIAADGVEATETWAKGLVANLARPPKGGDRDQILAAAAGQCDLAIANTYYLAGMVNAKETDQREAAAKVAVFWPNQAGRGVHVNVSGAALTQAAKNKAEAIQLLEFMAGDEAQAWYAEVNGEYPIRPGLPIGATLAAWGDFKADGLNLERLGELNGEAVRLMDRARWK